MVVQPEGEATSDAEVPSGITMLNEIQGKKDLLMSQIISITRYQLIEVWITVERSEFRPSVCYA